MTQTDNTIKQEELESLLGKSFSTPKSNKPEPISQGGLPGRDLAASDMITQAGEIEKSRQDIMLACLEAAKISTVQMDITKTPGLDRKAPVSPGKKQPVLRPPQTEVGDKKIVDHIMAQIVTEHIVKHGKHSGEK